tara:strand:+ start:1342 stop:2097 length:756 start_codon:yes stop_codon:yes gene_type:complete
MKDNVIEFLYPEKTESILKEVFPIRAVKNLPDWYKKLKHTMKNRTIKGCRPVADALTAGYILKMPQDLYIKHNYTEGVKKDSSFNYSFGRESDAANKLNLNVNTNTPAIHPIKQLGGKEGGCPFVKTNSNFPIYKIVNPFRIKTPPGYSCLFIPPLNNRDDRFEIISGIVDTDNFPTYINFPIVLNGDKYPVLETVVKIGTPIAQCIPFKREDWKMEIKEDYTDQNANILTATKRLLHAYKTMFWSKKSWK